MMDQSLPERNLMKNYKFIIALLLILSSCSAPLQKSLETPSGKNRSIVGVNITHNAFITFIKHTPDIVFFAKLADPAKIESGKIINSNYKYGDNLYLVDAEPGTYVIVATWWQTRDPFIRQPIEKGKYVSFYTTSLIEATRFEVKPGTFTYLGHFRVRDRDEHNTDDDVRYIYRSMLESYIPPTDLINCTTGMFSGNSIYSGKLISHEKNDRDEYDDFFEDTEKAFEGTGWLQYIKETVPVKQ